MAVFTPSEYIESKASLNAKILAIDEIIDAMLLKMADATAGLNPAIDEYQLDDGQMRIRTSYRSVDDIAKGIDGLEKVKQRYVNRLNGRQIVLRDHRSFR